MFLTDAGQYKKKISKNKAANKYGTETNGNRLNRST